MSGPVVVVQGTPVGSPHVTSTSNPYGASSSPGRQQASTSMPPTTMEVEQATGNSNNEDHFGRGEKQETKCRDPIFALLFYANVAAIVTVAAIYGPAAFEESNLNKDEYDGYIYASILCALVSFVFSAMGLWILMCLPETMIKISLVFVTALACAWMILGFVSGSFGMGLIGAIFFAISLCYAWAVWSRIPFATINLVTACTAVKANWGVIIYAYLLTALVAGWAIVWGIASVGVFDSTFDCDENNVCGNPNYGYLFLLFLAFFFGHQVLQYCVHVTVAGMTGNWWFEPSDAKHCCSPAVNNAFIRTMTTSFGSICFGSIIVAILQSLRMIANLAQAYDDGGIGVCIAECILACMAQIVEYFNKWAFIYVGLYGYSYLQAGKNVFTLFQNRGWEAIIADDLVGNTLLLVSLMVGAVIGCIGIIIEVTSDFFDEAGDSSRVVAFFVGFIVGAVICSVLMSTIGSGVNAVIVLFAEAPMEFDNNYPELSNRMRLTWSQVYPGSVY